MHRKYAVHELPLAEQILEERRLLRDGDRPEREPDDPVRRLLVEVVRDLLHRAHRLVVHRQAAHRDRVLRDDAPRAADALLPVPRGIVSTYVNATHSAHPGEQR